MLQRYSILNEMPMFTEILNNLGFNEKKEENNNESRYVAKIIGEKRMVIKVEACGYSENDIKVTYSNIDKIFEIKAKADKKENEIQRNIDITIDLPEGFDLKKAEKKIENGFLIINADLNVPSTKEDKIII